MFDGRNVAGKRFYLQCCLVIDELAAKGAVRFPSNLPQVFYKLLLKCSSKADPSAKAGQWKERLALDAGDIVAVANCQSTKPSKRPRLVVTQEIADEFAGDDGLDDPPDEEHVVVSVGGRRPAGSSSSTGVAVPGTPLPSVPGELPSAAYEQAVLPDDILGQPVKLCKRGRHHGFQVKCLNPMHVGCDKYRSTVMDMQLGPRGTEAFLGVWLSHAFEVSKEDHAGTKPTRVEMEAYLRDH